MMFKQIPYTIAKNDVQDFAHESIYAAVAPKCGVGGDTKFGAQGDASGKCSN